MRRIIFFGTLIIILAIVIGIFLNNKQKTSVTPKNISQVLPSVSPTPLPFSNPLMISVMRAKSYPGSDMKIEQTLSPGSNYTQYIASYMSDGLKIYGLLTIPDGPMPSGGWPAILFNHGYITPQTYETNPSVGQYASYLPPFAEDGYVVFKSDYRGNGYSQGQPEGAYYSPAYTDDVLNALSSLKRLTDPTKVNSKLLMVNSNKIGMWGHSMGGNITMRALVVDPKDIKVAVIWSGVVGTYTDLEHWHDPSYHPSAYELSLRYKFRSNIEQQYGTPESNPTFWDSIDPNYNLSFVTAPIQIHYSYSDEEVPPTFSEHFIENLKKAGKNVESFSYNGADHNLSQVFPTALQRSLAFFDEYLK